MGIRLLFILIAKKMTIAKMEYTTKLRNGFAILNRAGNDRALLGLSLLSIHGALEDFFRDYLIKNTLVPDEDRKRVSDQGAVQWKTLLNLMEKYGGLSTAERNFILQMNVFRQQVAHGNAFTGDRQQLENYADYVLKTLGVSVNIKVTPTRDVAEILLGWITLKLRILPVTFLVVAGANLVLWTILKVVTRGLGEYSANTFFYLSLIALFLTVGYKQQAFLMVNLRSKPFSFWWFSSLIGGSVLSFIIINLINLPSYKQKLESIEFINWLSFHSGNANILNRSLIYGFLLGLIIGVLQWLILKTVQEKRAFAWILANALELPLTWVGAMVILGAINKTQQLVPFLNQIEPISKWLLLLFAWPTLCSAITGLALAYVFSEYKPVDS